MKTFNTLLLSGLLAVNFVYAESAAGVDRDSDDSTAQNSQRPEPKPKPNKGDQERLSREEMLKQFDTDGDGKLSEEERGAAMEYRFEQMALRRFDKDGDGQLNEKERAEAEAFKAEREAKLLEKFDADGDGELSKEERAAARKAMQRQMGKERPQGSGGKGGKGGPANRDQGPPRSDELGDVPPPPPDGQ